MREQSPVCRILAGSWRKDPGPLSIGEESLAASAILLESTGAAALGWNRVARSPSLCESPAALRLRDRARAIALHAARHEAALGRLAALLHEGGFHPPIFKGWAVAQHYASPHLRPMGDVDLCAPPGRMEELAAFLCRHGYRQFPPAIEPQGGRTIVLGSPRDLGDDGITIDLQESLDRFFLPSPARLLARAVSRPVGNHALLTLAAEDHLRLVAIHFLQNGGWRPLWLCDVAAMLETLPAGFDWDLCLGPEPRRRRWIACVLQLAQELLGARFDDVPAECRVDGVPGWLRKTVLQEWTKPLSEHQARTPFALTLRHRRGRLFHEVRARWPNPIRSTVELDGAFRRLQPWPFQIAHFLRSVANFAARQVRSAARSPR